MKDIYLHFTYVLWTLCRLYTIEKQSGHQWMLQNELLNHEKWENVNLLCKPLTYIYIYGFHTIFFTLDVKTVNDQKNTFQN